MHNNAVEIVKSNLKIKKLKLVLILISSYLVVEVIAGFYTGSLALLADAGHMFADSFGIGLALIAAYYSKKEATPVHTFGFFRTEILASLFNSLILSLLSIVIIYEAYRRLFEPIEIQSIPMLVVAIIGLMINIMGMYFLRDQNVHDHHSSKNVKDLTYDSVSNKLNNKLEDKSQKDKVEDLNLKGARLELLGDTLGSIGVITGGVIITTTNAFVVDPIISIGLSLFIVPRIWSLLRKSVHILMEGVPSNIVYESVQQALLQVKGVTGVFDLHIWSITSGMHALSAHIVIIDPANSYNILHEINSLLEKKFKIVHSTIQIEKYHPTQ